MSMNDEKLCTIRRYLKVCKTILKTSLLISFLVFAVIAFTLLQDEYRFKTFTLADLGFNHFIAGVCIFIFASLLPCLLLALGIGAA